MSSTSSDRGTLGTVRNATLLLDLLSVGPAFQQLTELAKQSGLSLPTVHRLLRSLVAAGFVEQHPQSSRYGLGPEFVRLSERYLVRLPVLSALAPYLVELRNTTRATILVAILIRGSVVYVDRIDGDDVGGVYRVAHRVHSAFETAAGRVLLAHSDAEAWQQAIDRAVAQGVVPQGTCPHDFTDEQRDAWQQLPYLVLPDPQFPDFIDVAVPVTDQNDQIRAALSATANEEMFTDDVISQRVAPKLIRAATAAKQAMGDA